MRIRRSTVAQFLAAVAADQPAPGAGAAAGVVLALGAACACKALRISGRRGEDGDLAAAADRAEKLASRAIAVAQGDCDDFPVILKAPQDGRALHRLQEDGEAALRVSRELRTILEAYAESVAPDLTGDFAAALHLLDAAERIIARNLTQL